MNSLFSPHTFSTDWEVAVYDRVGRGLGDPKARAFAASLNTQLDLPVHTDWGAIEFGMGINTSLGQFRDRILRATRRATEMLAEYDVDLYPIGSHPVDPFFNAAHIHVGTLHDERTAIRLETALFAYSPAFAALAANSPFHRGARGSFKSYRIRNNAGRATIPGVPRDAYLSQPTWGQDASPKLYKGPTMEVRNIDSASSPAFLAELAVFVAAFVHELAERSDGKMIKPAEYQDYLTNRWLASRDGLQATFGWRGKTQPVVDLLEEMLGVAGPSLKRLGATQRDLPILGAMLKKRFTQADFAISIMKRYPDPYVMAIAHGNLLRHWEAFDEFLAKAPRLDPVPHPGRAGIVQEHLRLVGQGTHSHHPRTGMQSTPGFSEEIVEELVAGGWVEREITTHRGTLLHRRK